MKEREILKQKKSKSKDEVDEVHNYLFTLLLFTYLLQDKCKNTSVAKPFLSKKAKVRLY